MKDRRLVVMAAIVLAVLATAAVFLYVNNVRQEARTGGDLVPVVVAKQDVPSGSDLGQLARQGAFEEIDVPNTAYVAGSVQSLQQLLGKRNNAPILAGEQIPPARLEGGEQPEGGLLGIPKGFQAVTLALELPFAVNGDLQRGDHVQIYAVGIDNAAGEATAATVVPEAMVLRVTDPDPADESADKEILVTLALSPQVAQQTVFAEQEGDVYLGLLPPGETGEQLPATTARQVAR